MIQSSINDLLSMLEPIGDGTGTSEKALIAFFNQGRNGEGLRQLSMIKRQLSAQDLEARARNIEESLSLAREAVSLDVTDHMAWC